MAMSLNSRPKDGLHKFKVNSKGMCFKNASPYCLLSVAEEIQCLKYFFFRCCLVDTDVADVGQQGEVDMARDVLLVVCHVFVQAFVVVACDVHFTVVVGDEADCLSHFLRRELAFDARQI